MKRHLRFLMLLACPFFSCSNSSDLTMLVGTYTGGSSVGIYSYRFNSEDLTVQPLSEVAVSNPSFLTVTPDAKYVYSVSESGRNSTVSAFAFDKAKGTLRLLNQKTVGAGPCNVFYHTPTRTVATANYSDGSVSITNVEADGSLGEQQVLFKYEGQGINAKRQNKPYLHCVIEAPDKKALFAADLGTDKIHKIDIEIPKNGTKDMNAIFKKSVSFDVEPGSGPRHIITNKKGTRAYLINELSGMATVFSIDAGNKLTQLQTLLADTENAGGSADIHLSPDERFLYTSTRIRGDGIVIFSVNNDGTLKRIGYHATGQHPRNFAITPDGKRLLVACQNSNMIMILNIDPKTGLLTDSGKTITIDRPVCIKFVQ